MYINISSFVLILNSRGNTASRRSVSDVMWSPSQWEAGEQRSSQSQRGDHKCAKCRGGRQMRETRPGFP